MYTINEFESLTKQQMFDMAAKHIITTRQQSVDEDCQCCYSGSGCAASVFLKPECREKADNLSAPGWIRLADRGYVPVHEKTFIGELQLCHDSATNGEAFFYNWIRRMHELAKSYGLGTAVLDEVLHD